MQEKDEEKMKKLIKEVIKELKISNSFEIGGLCEERKTKTIRIYEVTEEKLKQHCKAKVYSPSQFASIAIEEKIFNETNLE